MPGRLNQKVAIVTGAASGLGRAIALAYHAEGAHVVCADLREKSRYESSAEETSITTHESITKDGGKAIFVQCDTTDPKQVESLVKKAAEWGGRLDIMVNNAGIAAEGTKPSPIWDSDLEAYDKTIAVNQNGVFYGCKYASKQMLSQNAHESGDQGWIINTASILGLVASPSAPAYCASKAAVVNITRSAALSCGPKKIHVNCICPGYTKSALTAPLYENKDLIATLEKQHPFGERLGEPEDLARAAVFLASDDARWVNGLAMTVDGGFTAQ
jgi:NAD(P)-dependent dehydrogenase (short-subunit alcohol dehydrogenase family)